MKILFLDIDGVLNKEGTKELFNNFTGLDPKLVDKFLTWRKSRDLEVVLSSSWRTDLEFKKHLNDNGIKWIGETPKLNTSFVRGIEIAKWLDANLNVTHFAILDDMSDMKPLMRHLVQTSGRWGLQDKHLKMIDKLLCYDETPK